MENFTLLTGTLLRENLDLRILPPYKASEFSMITFDISVSCIAILLKKCKNFFDLETNSALYMAVGNLKFSKFSQVLQKIKVNDKNNHWLHVFWFEKWLIGLALLHKDSQNSRVNGGKITDATHIERKETQKTRNWKLSLVQEFEFY